VADFFGVSSTPLNLLVHAEGLLSWTSISKQTLRRVSGLGRKYIFRRFCSSGWTNGKSRPDPDIRRIWESPLEGPLSRCSCNTVPPQCRQVSMSFVNTRLRPCARKVLLGADSLWNRVRFTRGFGTRAARRAIKSSGRFRCRAWVIIEAVCYRLSTMAQEA
jgi:hypothetical protein